MASSLNTQTLALANQIIATIGQLNGILYQINVLVAQWTQINGAAQLNAMSTCATNADGTLGASDASPVSGHVINTAIYPLLSRATSAYNIGLAENLLADISSLLQGNAVAAQASFPAILAQLTGG